MRSSTNLATKSTMDVFATFQMKQWSNDPDQGAASTRAEWSGRIFCLSRMVLATGLKLTFRDISWHLCGTSWACAKSLPTVALATVGHSSRCETPVTKANGEKVEKFLSNLLGQGNTMEHDSPGRVVGQVSADNKFFHIHTMSSILNNGEKNLGRRQPNVNN